MAQKYLDTATVDITFLAWWREYGRTPSRIQTALDLTRTQIGGPMPPNYYPPPWRKKISQTKNLPPMPSTAEAERVRLRSRRGIQFLVDDLKLSAESDHPDLPPDVALQIKMLPCYADPARRDRNIRMIVMRNWDKIERYSSTPQVSDAPARNIDQEYARRAAQREGIEALRKRSPIFHGPEGAKRARQVLANRQAMMLLDLEYLSQNTFAGGYYGIARAANVDHEDAMEQSRAFQATVDLLSVFAGGRKAIQGMKKRAPAAGWRQRIKTGEYFRQSGMPRKHFNAFKQAARESKKIVVVRMTKPASIGLIEKGAPSKGMDLSKIGIKCATSTGVATAQGKSQINAARKLGYFVVDSDGVARNQAGETLKLDASFKWQIGKGQIVHPKLKKPVVGDYDLKDVIDPNALGRRLVLATDNGKKLSDQTNPAVTAFRKSINAMLDQPRVLHGAHADFSGIANEGVVVFRPDGTAILLPDQSAVNGFFQSMNRPTRIGKHTPRGAEVGVE